VGGIGRIAFLGTGAFGVPLLERVAAMADDLLVVSQPDRPAGRRLQLRSTPIASFAREHGHRVVAPSRLRVPDAQAEIAAFQPDGILLVAYGQLVPQSLLDLGTRPPLNVHPSLLPQFPGARAIDDALAAGVAETGVTVHWVDEGLDTGDVIRQEPVPVHPTETLVERIHAVEHRILPEVVRELCAVR
jgi:methionyl-tRNA formyltransferase